MIALIEYKTTDAVSKFRDHITSMSHSWPMITYCRLV